MSNNIPEPPKFPALPPRPVMKPAPEPETIKTVKNWGNPQFVKPEEKPTVPQPVVAPEQNRPVIHPSFGNKYLTEQQINNLPAPTPPVITPPLPKSHRKQWIIGSVIAVVLIGLAAGTYFALPILMPTEPEAVVTPEPQPVEEVTELFNIPISDTLTINHGLSPDTAWTVTQPWSAGESNSYSTVYETIVNGETCYASIITATVDERPESTEAAYLNFMAGYLSNPTVSGGNTVNTVTYVEAPLASPDPTQSIPGRSYTIPVTTSTTVHTTIHAGYDAEKSPNTLTAQAIACQTPEALQTITTSLDADEPLYKMYAWFSN